MEKVIVAPEIVETATRLLEEQGVTHDAVKVRLKNWTEGEAFILSPNPEDLIPMHKIMYEGKTYYLGLPK